MANLTGQQLGNYRLVRLLGQGGFADVYLAEHIHLNSQAAIKVLQMRLVGSALEQFRNEGRSIASLIHPNIVRVFDFDVENGIPFLVMDYAPNGTLRQHYPKGSVFSAVSILPHFRQVALALQYAHDRKLIHRDIKPENMLLGANGEVLLSDFGLVLPAQSTGSQTTKEMAGTLPYMAPEQINGRPRAASDQYALGIVLYEWLSGDRPFRGSLVEIATQHLMTLPDPLYGKVPGVSLAIQEVVFTALAKEPLQRFASMQEFAAAFENVSQAEVHSSSSLPAVTGISAPVENTSSYPSTAPTYIKTPSSDDPQQSTVIKTPGHPQPPATTSPDHSQLPTVIKTPISPQQPPVPLTVPEQAVPPSSPAQSVTPAGGAFKGSTGGQPPTIGVMSNTLPASTLSSTGDRRRRKGRAKFLVVSLLLIMVLVVAGLAYAIVNGPGRSGAIVNRPGGSGTATMTITPASTDLKKTYSITAVTGTPDATRHQVEARFLSVPTQPRSKIVNATGIIPAVQATGELTFINATSVLETWGPPTGIGDGHGGDVELYKNVDIPAGQTVTVPAYAYYPGAGGNIQAYDINFDLFKQAGVSCNNVSPGALIVCNMAPFTGGRDASSQVLQSDIDSAANALEAGPPDAQQVLQGQMQAYERLIGTPSCKPNVNSNPAAGTQATSVTVTVTFVCTGEVYDQPGALTAAEQWLKQDAAKNPGTAYMLVGKVVTTQTQAQLSDTSRGTVTISVIAEGVWVFQFSDAQKAQLAHLVAGKSKSDAQSILQSKQGIKQVAIQLSGGGGGGKTLPSNPSQITISVQSVTGLG